MKEKIVNLVKREWKKTTDVLPARVSDFNREVEECLNYFNKAKYYEHKKDSFYLIHGSKVSVGVKMGKKKEYFLERDILYVPNLPPLKERFYIEAGNVVKTRKSYMDGKIIGNQNGEIVNRKELEEVTKLLHGITLPYAEYIRLKHK